MSSGNGLCNEGRGDRTIPICATDMWSVFVETDLVMRPAAVAPDGNRSREQGS
jgi:hypothetical protein